MRFYPSASVSQKIDTWSDEGGGTFGASVEEYYCDSKELYDEMSVL